MKKRPKPAGWKAFDRLARAVVNVPGKKVDAKIAADKAKRLKTRK